MSETQPTTPTTPTTPTKPAVEARTVYEVLAVSRVFYQRLPPELLALVYDMFEAAGQLSDEHVSALVEGMRRGESDKSLSTLAATVLQEMPPAPPEQPPSSPSPGTEEEEVYFPSSAHGTRR